ncbi:hypothetical protein DFH94DRAFT_682174 [Russula ochroleuca]|uniref:Uncharacterized protein n=1 Tax=Russula ochroleuca TaxID=152965 RepID=A0A9P5T974_9AGAM|nr:hypothetical protein DFH94DRAFT_682174 [Russula ochroleuca]
MFPSLLIQLDFASYALKKLGRIAIWKLEQGEDFFAIVMGIRVTDVSLLINESAEPTVMGALVTDISLLLVVSLACSAAPRKRAVCLVWDVSSGISDNCCNKEVSLSYKLCPSEMHTVSEPRVQPGPSRLTGWRYPPAGMLQGTRSEPQRRCRGWPRRNEKPAASWMLVSSPLSPAFSYTYASKGLNGSLVPAKAVCQNEGISAKAYGLETPSFWQTALAGTGDPFGP